MRKLKVVTAIFLIWALAVEASWAIPTITRFKDGQTPIVVLDPGHGGKDQGAIGVGGLMEKDLVLLVALDLRRFLESELGVIVKLTREADEFVPLTERTALANDYEATLFVSLHANASKKKGAASGFEVYYLDNGGDEASKKLAERENSSLLFEEEQNDISFILSDLIQNAKLEDSITLANRFNQETVGALRKEFKGIKSIGVKKAPFYVLVGAHMPCVLLELFFVDHQGDARLLTNPDFRSHLTTGLGRAIERYLIDDLNLVERR